MDVYSLTRKKRPSRLTLAQPPRTPSDNDSALDVPISRHNVSKYPSRSPLSYIYDEVVGEPTRAHWKNDSDSSHCEFPGCLVTFGLFDRRHHCRKCGDIYCSTHCSNYFRLNQFAQFHPRGVLSRGCDTCAADYNRWQAELQQMRGENTSSKPHTDKITEMKLHAGIMTQQPQAMEGVTELGREDVVPVKMQPKGMNINRANKKDTVFNPVPSVPADWQWSTF